jgi:hypothetical protein
VVEEVSRKYYGSIYAGHFELALVIRRIVILLRKRRSIHGAVERNRKNDERKLADNRGLIHENGIFGNFGLKLFGRMFLHQYKFFLIKKRMSNNYSKNS